MIFYTNINLDFCQSILQPSNPSTYITIYAKPLITANSLVFAIILKHLTEYGIKVFYSKENGIGDSLLLWQTNYLENRGKKVVIQASEFNFLPLKAGVPQGSVLGPLLFLIYVNDITESLLRITRLYADDSSLYYSVTSPQDIEGIINHDLRNVSIWAKQWLVDFNPNKTEAVIFSSRRDHREPVLYFEHSRINIVDQHEHLGITLRSSGLWNDHINNTLNAVSKIIHIMRRLQFTLTRATLNQIYLSHVRPILEYSSIV